MKIKNTFFLRITSMSLRNLLQCKHSTVHFRLITRVLFLGHYERMNKIFSKILHMFNLTKTSSILDDFGREFYSSNIVFLPVFFLFYVWFLHSFSCLHFGETLDKLMCNCNSLLYKKASLAESLKDLS